MHVFTSIAANYLPKARVLSRSLKRVQPDAQMHVVLSDRWPAGLCLADEPFDSVIPHVELPIPQVRSWTFKHGVGELCTAVKAAAFQEIMRRFQTDRLYYIDPDIAILGSLDPLEELLDRHSILITPHVARPEESFPAIVRNELGSLRGGVYNLGFLAVRGCDEGRRFLDWWAHRLQYFCQNNVAAGLFTDQRWIDLVPVYFPGVGIVREPEYNVAAWNLTQRQVTGRVPDALQVEGRPVAFFHFSGFDSGVLRGLIDHWGRDRQVLADLHDWYAAELARHGQSRDGSIPWAFGRYDDGIPIQQAERETYRSIPDLEQRFPDPFRTRPVEHSFRHWFRAAAANRPDSQAYLVELLRAELLAVTSSRAWRLTRTLSNAWQKLRRPAA